MKLNCTWTARPWSELCYFTHWVEKHRWGTNKPYLQAPLSALLSRKVGSIQREEISTYPATQDTSAFLSTHWENTAFAKKRAIHHTSRLQHDISQGSRTAAAASSICLNLKLLWVQHVLSIQDKDSMLPQEAQRKSICQGSQKQSSTFCN